MKKDKLITKLFLYLSVLSGSVWIGTYLLRLSLSYQLFEPIEFVVKSNFTPENILGFLSVFIIAIKTTSICYLIFIVSYIVFISTTNRKLKQNGWLFIITIIIFLTFPFEIYLMTIDYKIIQTMSSASFMTNDVLNLIVKRLTSLNGFPLMEIFAYFSIIYFVIFQPLKMTEKLNEN
jgi:hypothetical protein